MESDFYLYLTFFISLICSGFFSASEATIISISPERSKQLIEDGGARGKALSFVSKNFTAIFTTILIGNNLVNILAASISAQLAAKYFNKDGLAISVAVTTIIIILIGEIIPKTIGRNFSEKLIVPFTKILQINYILFYPAVVLITWIINKVLGKNAVITGRLVTKDDIEFMVNRAEKEKSIDSKQIDLLNSILEFPTIKVKDIMVPRSKVVYIPLNMPFDEAIKVFNTHNHSRYPVCEDGLDQTIGFLHVKDLIFVSSHGGENFNVKQYLKTPFFVYEHMKIQAVFDHMNRKKVHLALVKDENGLVVGIITLEDIVEEILGEINDEHDDTHSPPPFFEEEMLREGITIKADISLRDLYNNYDIKIPLNDNYSTLAGFLLDMMGNNFPKEGMMLFWDGFSFKLDKVDNYEIISVVISDVEGEKHLYSKAADKTNPNFKVTEGSSKKDTKKDNKDKKGHKNPNKK